ncbi:hypothetical protein MBLNU230_g1773t1 [Neophaeotheca triangularis]
MPRKLPWVVEARNTQPGTSTVSSNPAPATKKRKTTPPTNGAVLDDDLNPLNPINPTDAPPSTPPARKTRPRTPSTSPPPAPPTVEPMREGWEQDDAWMMVEDELLSTARLFTSHIHHAEYVRLKQLARSRGDGALAKIARPVDARVEKGAGLKLREEAAAQEKVAREERAADEEQGEEVVEDEPWKHDAQLAELMSGLGRERRDLTGLVRGANGAGKAARRRSSTPLERMSVSVVDGVGVGPSRRGNVAEEEETEEEDDDLDAQVLKSRQPSMKPQASRRSPLQKPSRDISREKENKRPPVKKESCLGVSKSFADSDKAPKPPPQYTARSEQATKPDPVKPAPTPSVKKERPDTDVALDFDDMPARSQRSTQALSFLAKRMAEREKKERERKDGEQKGKVKKEPGAGMDEIPFWMP